MTQSQGPTSNDRDYVIKFLDAVEHEIRFLTGHNSHLDQQFFSRMVFEMILRERRPVYQKNPLDLDFSIPVWKLAHVVMSADEACLKGLTQEGVVQWFEAVVTLAHLNQTYKSELRIKKAKEKLFSFEEPNPTKPFALIINRNAYHEKERAIADRLLPELVKALKEGIADDSLLPVPSGTEYELL